MLQINHYTKQYTPNGPKAVDDLTLHIRPGEIYGFLGHNGAGKTTIMRMISGLSAPTSGSYSLFGKTGYAMGKMLKNVGVLIESPGLYPKFSAYENLKIKCVGIGINPKGYVEELLKTVGLENTDKKKKASAYSLGMRQRLGIGPALVGGLKMAGAIVNAEIDLKEIRLQSISLEDCYLSMTGGGGHNGQPDRKPLPAENHDGRFPSGCLIRKTSNKPNPPRFPKYAESGIMTYPKKKQV